MRRHWVGRGLKFLVLVGVAAAAFSGAVMLLWNGLMPDLFGWRPIGFFQAFGLLLLGRILFGRFGGRWGGHHHSAWRERMMERWVEMTPDEREKFQAGLRGRCGWRSAPPADAAAKA